MNTRRNTAASPEKAKGAVINGLPGSCALVQDADDFHCVPTNAVNNQMRKHDKRPV
jgi:hypothetical protein